MVPYQNVIIDGQHNVETMSSFSPAHDLVRMVRVKAGVNADPFYKYATYFTQHIQLLTANNCKFLLTYDVYRFHMTLCVLQHLHNNSAVLYALSAHTSGKTQPLDPGVLRRFKHAMDRMLATVDQNAQGQSFDLYEQCAMMSHAYKNSFNA